MLADRKAQPLKSSCDQGACLRSGIATREHTLIFESVTTEERHHGSTGGDGSGPGLPSCVRSPNSLLMKQLKPDASRSVPHRRPVAEPTMAYDSALDLGAARLNQVSGPSDGVHRQHAFRALGTLSNDSRSVPTAW